MERFVCFFVMLGSPAIAANMKSRRFIFGVLLALLIGCGNSTSNSLLTQRRQEGIAELHKIQTTVQGLHLLVSAGITKMEYSQRLEDALLAAGDLDDGAKVTMPKFKSTEQEEVRDIYKHLSQSLQSYKTARDYFGDKFNGPGCEDGCSLLTQQDYDAQKAIFPTLIDLQPEKVFSSLYPGSPPSYYRRDMLRALWKVAGEEEASAKFSIDRLGP